MDPSDLYKLVDLHPTESVPHNKFLNEDLPKLFALDHKVGHILDLTITYTSFSSQLV